MQPSLSVILPNYNHARLLPRALDALSVQGIEPLEILAIDDASSDDSVAILNAYAARHRCMQVTALPEHRGIYRNLIDGVMRARGDWITFAASDDHHAPDYFEKAMRLAAQHPQAGVVVGDVLLMNDKGKVQRRIAPKAWRRERYVAPDEFLRDCLMREEACFSFGPTAVYRRECLQKVIDIIEQAGPFSDTFQVQAVALEHGLCYANAPGIYFRVSDQSVSGRGGLDDALARAERVAALMRGERFRHVFPEEFVSYWEKDYRRWARKHFFVKRLTASLPGLHYLLDAARFVRRKCASWLGR